MILYPPEMRHFRGFRTNVHGNIVFHPAYIVGEAGDCYLAYVITHSPVRGKNHKNHLLTPNPNPKDPRDSYMANTLKIRSKKWFRKGKMRDLNMSEENNRYVDFLVSKIDEAKVLAAIQKTAVPSKEDSTSNKHPTNKSNPK